jgi:hypothetical protein
MRVLILLRMRVLVLLPHTSAYVSIRQCVSSYYYVCASSSYSLIRQHPSAYANACPHTTTYARPRPTTSSSISRPASAKSSAPSFSGSPLCAFTFTRKVLEFAAILAASLVKIYSRMSASAVLASEFHSREFHSQHATSLTTVGREGNILEVAQLAL